MEDIYLKIQWSQQALNRIKKKKTMLKHVLVKLLKIWDKGKILRGTREKCQITYKKMIWNIPYFLSETTKARWQWKILLKCQKGNRSLLTQIYIFGEFGQNKDISNKRKLRVCHQLMCFTRNTQNEEEWYHRKTDFKDVGRALEMINICINIDIFLLHCLNYIWPLKAKFITLLCQIYNVSKWNYIW